MKSELQIFGHNAMRSLSKEDMAALGPALEQHVMKIAEFEGERAFESPRSAAIAHEVGHAIVGTGRCAAVRCRRCSPRSTLYQSRQISRRRHGGSRQACQPADSRGVLGGSTQGVGR